MNQTVYSDYRPMEWNADHSIEVPELDRHHKELTSFYNETLNHCSGDKTEEREYFNKTIDAFIKSLSKHFEVEEQFLFGKNYVKYEQHKLDHIKLLEKINFIKNEIQNNKWEMKLFILAITLKDTLMYHFNSYDMSAKECFKEENNIQTTDVNCFAFQG